MGEETDVDAGMMIMEDEQMNDEREDKGNQEKGSSVREQSTVIMTGKEFVKGSTPDREVGKEGSGLSELGSFCWEVFNHYIAVRVVRGTE